MKIKIYGELLECGAVIKSENSVTILDENGCVMREDTGIHDFSGYTMVEGEWTEREIERTPTERIAGLEKKTAEFNIMNAALENALCEIDIANEYRFIAIENALCELDCVE